MDAARHAEIVEALAVLLEPGQVTEMRAFLPSRKPHQASGVCYRNHDLLARRALEIEPEVTGIYVTVNPLDPALIPKGRDRITATANGTNVVCRRWLLIDVDPIRLDAEGQMIADVPSTDDERAAAWNVLQRCKDTCETFGMIGGVVGDSGNGWHLLYPIDLLNSDESTSRAKDFLAQLRRRCGDESSIIDPKVCDAPRIWKLYGTLAQKGPHTVERPHRYSRIVEGQPPTQEMREKNNEVLQEMLSIWAAQMAAHAPPASTGSSVIDRARAYLEKEDVAISGTGTGQGSKVTYHVACILVWGFGLSHEEALAAISDWNARCVPPWSENELRHKFDDALKGSHKESRGHLRDREMGPAGKMASGASPVIHVIGSPGDVEELVLRASKVERRPIEWLWPGRIPLGKLTTFAGQGGVGKTFTLCDITARITTGSCWPDDPTTQEPANVLFISGEDDADDTLVPRLIELGADLERVCFLADAAQSIFTLGKVDTLERAIKQTGGNVKLVVIDPPASYLGGADDHSNAELRQVLTPLKVLASRLRLAIVFNTHLNKGGAGKVDAMARVMASVAWVNAVRAAHLFAVDPDDETGERVLFVPLKLNLGRKRKGLAYRIVEASNDLARVEWLGEIDTTADQAITKTVKAGPRAQEALAWLIEQFRHQKQWPSKELVRNARELNINRNAIFEAKSLLGEHAPSARKVTHSNGDTEWIWSVPDNWPPLNNRPDERAF